MIFVNHFKDGNDLAKARKIVNNWTPEMDKFATTINNAMKNYGKSLKRAKFYFTFLILKRVWDINPREIASK